MPVWLQLALQEFTDSLRLRPRIAGTWDYPLLTVFLGLIICLVVLAGSAWLGMREQLESALFGRIGDAGTPVVLRMHPDLAAFEGGLSRDAIQAEGWIAGGEASNGASAFWPFRRIEAGETGIGLPGGEAAWRGETADRARYFDGWAVYRDDPLWRSHAGDAEGAGTPLTPRLIVSEAAFGEAFDYAAYRADLASLLPAPIAEALPGSLSAEGVRGLDQLWLRIDGARARAGLVRFDLTWVPSLSPDQHVAFLFPMDLLDVLQASRDTTTREPPLIDSLAEPQDAVSDLTVYPAPGMDSAALDDQVADLAACLNGEPVPTMRDATILLPGALPWSWIEPCLERHGVEPLRAPPAGLTPPVTTLAACWTPGSYVHLATRALGSLDCRDLDLDEETRIDVLDRRPFLRFRLYVAPDADMSDQIDAYTAADSDGLRRFVIDSSYDATLRRLDYLNEVLNWLKWPVVAATLIALVFAVAIQVIVTVRHRRAVCSILLADGLPRRRIVRMFHLQILLSTLLGAAGAGLVALGTIWLMNRQFLSTPEVLETTRLLGLDAFAIMDTSQRGVVFVAAVLFAWVAARVSLSIALWTLPLGRRTEPTDLMA